jgi:hypothetical protein
MEIRFISSLTADDEDQYAPAVLKAVSALLDEFPIAYTIRIETTSSQVFQHTHAVSEQCKNGHANGVGDLLNSVSPYGMRGRQGS